MQISFKLFSNFALYHSPSKFHLKTGEGSSVVDICRSLEIPEGLPRINMVNGQMATDQTILKDGDIFSFSLL